jgi:hypothetical protein
MTRFQEGMTIGPSVHVAQCVRRRAVALLGSCALVAALSVGATTGARAAGPAPSPNTDQLFGVHPALQGSTTLPGGHFNFALLPGERITDAIVVENFSDHNLTFHIYGADLLTASGGGVAPAQPTAPMREVGAWITVSRPVVTIRAHGEVTDSFTVQVPSGVSIGQHLGAVVAAADVGATPEGNPIEARAALVTVVTVPGAAHPLATLGALTGSEATVGIVGFDITLSNTGNVLLTYAGTLTIDDRDGHRVATLPLTPISAYVVPTGHVALTAAWKEVIPLADQYSAKATVTVLADGTAVQTLTSQSLLLTFASGIPVVVVVESALALTVALVLLIWSLVRASRRRRMSPAPGALGARVGGLR